MNNLEQEQTTPADDVDDDAEQVQLPQRSLVLPTFDTAIFDDDRVLENLLHAEKRITPSPAYFSCVQTEIDERHRRMLTEWMMDVVDEERCDVDVFVMAVNYLDRFLSQHAVHKMQLQTLGCACIFLASKVKQPQPMSARRLVEYTAHSTDLGQLISWEMLVLNKLQWDLCAVTAYDYLEHVLHRLKLPRAVEDALRPRLACLVPSVATEFRLAVLRPSIVALGCLCFAVEQVLDDAKAASKNLLAHLMPVVFKQEASYLLKSQIESVRSFLETTEDDVINGGGSLDESATAMEYK